MSNVNAMKKLLTVVLLSVILLSPVAVSAKPLIKFKETSYKFGEISEKGGIVKHEFKFENDGDEPLIITGVSVTCSCTKTEFTRKPLAPGEEGSVIVAYDPKRQEGTFYKAINVYTNSEKPRTILTIGGTVVK